MIIILRLHVTLNEVECEKHRDDVVQTYIVLRASGEVAKIIVGY